MGGDYDHDATTTMLITAMRAVRLPEVCAAQKETHQERETWSLAEREKERKTERVGEREQERERERDLSTGRELHSLLQTLQFLLQSQQHALRHAVPALLLLLPTLLSCNDRNNGDSSFLVE